MAVLHKVVWRWRCGESGGVRVGLRWSPESSWAGSSRFAQSAGATTASPVLRSWGFRAADGAVAECHVPFPRCGAGWEWTRAWRRGAVGAGAGNRRASAFPCRSRSCLSSPRPSAEGPIRRACGADRTVPFSLLRRRCTPSPAGLLLRPASPGFFTMWGPLLRARVSRRRRQSQARFARRRRSRPRTRLAAAADRKPRCGVRPPASPD